MPGDVGARLAVALSLAILIALNVAADSQEESSMSARTVAMTYGKLSRVHGNGLGEHLQPEAGQKMVVYLELIDPLGTEMVDISVLGKVQAHLNITGEEDFSVPFELNEQMGTLEAAFEYTVVGFYRVQVVVSGQPLEKEYTLAVKPGPADIDSVWVMMVTHGEIGGDDITFKLQFWDAFDNLLTASNVEAELNFYGSKVVGVFKDSRGGVKEKMIHLGQGLKIEAKTYSKEFIGTFQPTMAGEWRVQVVVNGKEKENPLWPKMQVSPGRLDADGCQVEGLGAAFMQRAGHSYRLAIVPGDKMGNEISPTRPEMGYGCAVDVVYKKDPTNADTIAREIGQKLRFHETDNAYYLQFQPTRSGTLLVEVRILGVEIPQSPLRIGVYPEVADPNRTTLAGECKGLGYAMIGIASKVIVVARDKYGNAAWHLEDPWEVVLSSAASPDQAMPTRFESVGNGNHTVKYELPAVGLYQMSVQLQGQHVTGSPLEITALDLQHGGDLVPENSIAEMPLFLDGEAVAGEPMHVNLYLRDHDCFPGRLGSEPTSFVLQLRHADTDGAAMELNLTTGEVAGDNAGALRGTAYPDIAGVFDAMVGVRIGSADLAYLAPQEGRAWPVQLEVVPSSPSSQESSIAISSIRPDDKGHFIAEAGTTLELNVTLRDDFGNVLKPGHFPALLPKMVLHTAENPTADFYAQSEYGAVGNGTAAVNVTRAGAVLLVLRLDGKPLASADLTVIGGPAAKGLATATGNTTSALPFEEASITLQMRDVFGNKAAFPPGLQCSATVAVAEDAGGSAPGPFATNSSARCLEGHSAGSVEIRYTLAAKEGSFNLSIRLLANEGWGDHYQLPVVVAGDAIISHAGALLQDSDVLDSPGIDPLGAGHQLGAGSPATDRSFIPGLGAGSAVAVVASAAAGFVVLSAILCLWAIRRRSKDDIDLLTRRLLPKPGLVSRTSIMPDEEAPTAEKLMGPGDGGRPAAGVKVAGPRRPSYFQDMSRESEANGDESPVEAGSNAAARGPKPRKGEEGSAESKAADGRRGSSLLVSFGQELQDVLAIELPTSMPRRSELPEPEDPTGPAYILSQAQREDAEREEMACGTINAKPPRPAASLSSPVRQSRVLVRGDSASDSRTGKTLAMYPEGLAEPKGDRLIPADSKSGAREDVGLEGSEDAPSSQSDEELDPGPRLSVESLAQSQRSSGALSAILAAAQRAFQHHRPPAGEQGGESEQPAPQGGKQADAARQDHPGQLFSPDPVPLTDCRPQGHRGMAKLPPVDLLAQRRQQAEAPGRLASALRASMQSMGLSSWDGMRRDAVTIVPSSIASPNRLSPLGEGPKQTRLPSLKGSEGAQLPFLGGRGADGLVSNEPASPRALGHQPRAARPLDELPSPDGGSPYPDLGHPQHLLARESDPEIGPLRYPEARDSLQSPDQRADAPGGGRPGQPSPLDSPAGSGGSDGSHPPASPASSAGVLWDILSGAEASSLPFAPTSSRPPRSPSSSYSSSQHSEHQVLLDPAELESSLIVASTGFPPGLLTPESPSEPTQWPSAAQGSAPTLAGSQTTPRDGDGPHPPPLPPWRRPSTRAGVLESLSAAQPPQRRFSNSSNKWGHTHVQPSDDGSRPSDEPPVRLQKTRGTWDGAL